MTIHSYLEVGLFFLLLLLVSPVLGSYIARIFSPTSPTAIPGLSFLEAACLRGIGRAAKREMDWRQYVGAVLTFNALGIVWLLFILMAQGFLPLNPQAVAGMPFWLALNTAVSFVTNTNWQAYSGEASLSYFSQAVGLTVQNFASAAVGISVMVALARGMSREKTIGLGNFWSDLTRTTVYLLLPLSAVLALVLVSQGVIQNFAAYVRAETLAGVDQVLPMGPAASQIAIKQLGTNGGGFFGVNSAHPFENPTPLSNFLQCLSILLIPAALPFSFGILAGNKRHGIALFLAMYSLFALTFVPALWSESQPNVALGGLPFLEGKEVRLGIGSSVLWSSATTVASNGSVNAMHDSLSPITGGLAIVNMLLGEVVFGGVGSGVYGMVLFAILTVFIAGLMVGRTPEYLGKKIEASEIRGAVVGTILPSAVVLVLSAVAISLPVGLSSLANRGPHGLSEILYAFASGANNNGSAFGGLSVNSPFYNALLALAMILGRFGVILPVLFIAGSLGRKQKTPASLGTFRTQGPLFVALLCGVVLIVGALTFFPVLSLGPVMEHLLMLHGRLM